jgi:hypothetical protein
MWVLGNIPFGIVKWWATVVLSNTNVPALGTQMGWWYNGGGSTTLELVSIPNQIVGSFGSISTALFSTTTSNVFNFSIRNSSGGPATINYGWVKLS